MITRREIDTIKKCLAFLNLDAEVDRVKADSTLEDLQKAVQEKGLHDLGDVADSKTKIQKKYPKPRSEEFKEVMRHITFAEKEIIIFAVINIVYIWASFGQIHQDLIVRFVLDNRIYITLILFRFNKYNDYIYELSV